MASLNIAVATTQDIPELCDLLAVLFSQEAEFTPDRTAQMRGLQAIIDAPTVGHIFVARLQGRLVGMVNLLYTVSTALGKTVALLEDMVVAPDCRDQGVGGELIESAIAHARAAGVGRITVLSDRQNLAAHRFYQRHGFSHSSMIPLRISLE